MAALLIIKFQLKGAGVQSILLCVPLCWGCYLHAPLCVGRSKGKAGIHLKCYPENRDTFEIYPRKVMHMIGG